MTFFETQYTNPDTILAEYQTRRKEVLYAELLLAAANEARSGASGQMGGTQTGGGILIGGGDIEIYTGCFATATRIATPHGIFNFREIYDRFTRGRREIYSFNDNGKIETDHIINIWHGIKETVELVFDGIKITTTKNHLFYPAFDEKKAVRDFRAGDTNLFYLGDKWKDLRLLDIIETDAQEVWNMGIKKNKCYLPEGAAVSNRKYEGQPGE